MTSKPENPVDSTTRPARHVQILDRDIWVFDGLLENVGFMVTALDRAPFTRTEVATPETAQYRHWAAEMDLRVLANLPLYKATMSAISSVMADRRYRAYRSYTNFASHGDVLLIHTDCLPGADEYTALWYLANKWDADWGGETLFYDEHRDAQFVVTPKPGRLVIFHGSIPHAGRPPARHCHEARYSFAIKLERDPASNG